ncbi:MAG: hypothetical protein ACJ74T_15560 [Pyrinomonadaceae bacterium]
MDELLTLQPPVETVGANGGAPLSKHCYAALFDQWAKARIEGPVQVVTRLDDAVKLLITLGGLFPVILVAAYTPLRQAQPPAAGWLWQPPALLFGAFLLFFLGFVICLMMACKWQLRNKLRGPWQEETREVCLLLKEAVNGRLGPDDITDAVTHWTEALDELIKYKHRWVQFACVCLTVSSTCMMVLLFVTAMGVRLVW